MALVRLLANESDHTSFTIVANAFNIPTSTLVLVAERLSNGGLFSVLDSARKVQAAEGGVEIYKLLYAVDRVRQCLYRNAPKASLRNLLSYAIGLIPEFERKVAFDTQRVLETADLVDTELRNSSECEEFNNGDEEDDMMALLGKGINRRQDRQRPFQSAMQQLRKLLDIFIQLEEDSDLSTFAESKSEVLCTTMHQAKGLEWRVVFLPRMNDGIMPLEMRSAEACEEHIDEERRVCYVAMSRARERLFISYLLEECNSILQPSRFLADLQKELITQETIYAVLKKDLNRGKDGPPKRKKNRKNRSTLARTVTVPNR